MQHSSRWQCNFHKPSFRSASDNESSQWDNDGQRRAPQKHRCDCSIQQSAISNRIAPSTFIALVAFRCCSLTATLWIWKSVPLASTPLVFGGAFVITNEKSTSPHPLICGLVVMAAVSTVCVPAPNRKLGQVFDRSCCQNNAPNQSRETVSETQRSDQLNRMYQQQCRLSRLQDHKI